MTRVFANLAYGAYRVLFDHAKRREPEPVTATPRPMIGFFATLSDQEKRAALSYRGPENHGAEELRRPAAR